MINLLHSNIAALISGAMLATIAVIFSLLATYSPFLGVFIATLWPVPFVLQGLVHGLRACIISLVVASLLVMFLVNTLYATSIICGFSLVAISLVYAIQKNFSLSTTIYISIAASLFSKYLTLTILIQILGFNPLVIAPENIAAGISKIMRWAQTLGLKPQQLTILQTNIPSILQTVSQLLPSGFVIAALIDSIVNYSLVQKIAAHILRPIKKMPEFDQIYMPKYISWLFVVSAMLIIYLPISTNSPLSIIAFNTYIFSLFMLIVQAISGIFYLANKTTYPRLIKNISLLLILSNPLFAKIAALFAIHYLNHYLYWRKLTQER